MRPHTKDSIEHKLFIVMSGSLQSLDPQRHTQKPQPRRGPSLMRWDCLCGAVRCFIDTEDLVDGGSFLHKSSNGVLFETYASEGFWLFTGPPDHASYNTYGTIFNFHKDMTCFPTSTLRYHEKFPPRGTVVSTQHGG